MSALTLVVFAVMFFGWTIYYSYVYNWLWPDAPYEDKWLISDFVVLSLFMLLGLSSAAMVAWQQAQSIVRPLNSVATAARSVAQGNFSARAQITGKAYGEAETLLSDFNTMAARLEHAEKELAYSNSAIAHELRTPLTILRGRLQGLYDGAFEPTPELYLRLIAHVHGLSRIVEDLRILGLSTAGRLDLNLQLIDLAAEAEAVQMAMEFDLSKADIRIVSDLEHVEVLADSFRIRQVLFALLENAGRYAAGSVVTISTGQTADQAFIRCSDTGPGFPSGTEDRVFERFWRGEEIPRAIQWWLGSRTGHRACDSPST